MGHHRLLNDLKKKIRDAGLTVEEFCEAIGIIYGDFTDRAAHSVPLPPEIKDADLLEVAKLLEVDMYEHTTKTLDILVRKLCLVNDEDVDVAPQNSSKSAPYSDSGNESCS